LLDKGCVILMRLPCKKAIVCFHESKLAAEFSKVLSIRLQQAGLEETKAQLLTERVAWNTHRYLSEAWGASGDAHLAQPAFGDWREEQERYHSIDEYLETKIATKPLETVFAEKFTFKDIYVPLKVKTIDKNGQLIENTPSEILDDWATSILHATDKQGQVMFVQGGPGLGKSVFCRMFADWVRQHLYPIWIPILIRLRDIDTFEQNFEQTLRAAVDTDFAKNDDGWLTDRNTRYLFLLDGFDELRMEGRTSGGIEQFLKQVGGFQRDCAESRQLDHRVLITGRDLALQGIERFMPSNLERVEIQPLDDEQQAQWLEKWGILVGAEPDYPIDVFQDERLPEQVRELRQEPLLLYLMSAMHRDGELKLEMFERATKVGAKVLLYQRMLDWVITKQRPRWLNQELTELQMEGLRRILAEAGLCVMQSGGEVASISMLEARLKNDNNAKMLLETAQHRLGETPLRNALTSFYLSPGSTEGSVEFAHKSFGEFLCAERLKVSLEDWSLEGKRRYQEFEIPTEQMHWEIYDLLGAKPLTLEIVEYLLVLLEESEGFSDLDHFVRLFKRLEQFYFRWSEGEFIDAPPENFPQKKMRLLRDRTSVRDTPLETRQVDVYAGLNVTILLLELYQYSQSRNVLKDEISFSLCGTPETGNFDKHKLLRNIGYSQCCGTLTFARVLGKFFKEKILNWTVFAGSELPGADFRAASLKRAYFSRAYLPNANFSGADLGCTRLEDADLNGANLTGTDLIDIVWDENTNWDGVQGLEKAINVPEALKQQLGLTT
jgi:NACHT domain/Pentapeptide repeats (9 copies)